MRFALIFQLGVYVLTWLLAPFIADLFSDHPQVVRLIVLYLHLVPIGYGFQGMVMLLASALNGVRASAVSLLINGIRLFVFLLPGAWLGAKLGGEQGIYLGMLLANLAAGLLAWGYARHRFERLCHQGRS
jgi:Na+-driven multidrug efflux pump